MGMEWTYYAQAFTALVRVVSCRVMSCPASCTNPPANLPLQIRQAATKLMVQQGVKGKVIFCSSILGYFSIVGYSPYSPGKFALRGEHT